MLWNFIWMMSSVNICDRWCSCASSDLVLLWRTDGKQFNPSIPQSLCGRHHIVLWLPVRDEDSDFGNTRPGSRLWFEAVLKDEGQSQTWKDTHTQLNENTHAIHRKTSVQQHHDNKPALSHCTQNTHLYATCDRQWFQLQNLDGGTNQAIQTLTGRSVHK